MRKTISNTLVIVIQLLIVGVFFTIVFNDDISLKKHVNIAHNDNLSKIASSVSVLFQGQEDKKEIKDDVLLEELPAIKVVEEKEEAIVSEEEKEQSTVVTTPLVSLDSSKYSSNEDMGFVVSDSNKEYVLEGNEFDVVVAVVAGEFDKNLNDALGVVSVILNRCDSPTWSSWAGSSPYDQVVRKGQFSVYSSGIYLKYMPNGKEFGSSKYEIAKQAVLDGLHGIRNNKYLGFRAWHVSKYSDKYIVYGGNRYGYN